MWYTAGGTREPSGVRGRYRMAPAELRLATLHVPLGIPLVVEMEAQEVEDHWQSRKPFVLGDTFEVNFADDTYAFGRTREQLNWR